MAQLHCPVCHVAAFTWSIDESASPLTRWDCSACHSHFHEDESLASGFTLALYASSSVLVWCPTDAAVAFIPYSAVQSAVHEYQEWGEKLRIDRRVRIAALLPDLPSSSIALLCSIGSRVEAVCWDVASRVRDSGLSQEAAYSTIQAWFPFMSADNLARSYSQAMYYTLK
jgi:hypothetical protein